MKYTMLTMFTLLSGCGAPVSSEGPMGQAGYNTLVEVSPVSTCPNGGVTIETALDVNRNFVIDSVDLYKTTTEVCNGTDGKSCTKTGTKVVCQ